ncbi:mitochondrial ribosomal protein L53 [Calliopsis andreniformis]|uniref:mitochondrial ribosomal protein L53 n=1 Tax=Calliopsis andreniformis TaxID=337506 RepID=UPI003FCCAE7A
MSIPFNGTRTRSKGIISAIAKHLRNLTLKPVKSINVKFDPYHNALEARDFFFHITTPKIIATNPRCIVKPKIVSDLSEPEITVKLLSGDNIVFKSSHLTCLNILELYNKHITPLSTSESKADSENIGEEEKKPKKRRRLRIRPGGKRKGVFL